MKQAKRSTYISHRDSKKMPNICPRCGLGYQGYPALSRLDNKTNICSPCGTDEALRDMLGLLEYDDRKSWKYSHESV